jgi:hypothetical protein
MRYDAVLSKNIMEIIAPPRIRAVGYTSRKRILGARERRLSVVLTCMNGLRECVIVVLVMIWPPSLASRDVGQLVHYSGRIKPILAWLRIWIKRYCYSSVSFPISANLAGSRSKFG